MDRRLFHAIGYAAPILLLPYFMVLSIGKFREDFPLAFFFSVTAALVGIISGILWLMFALELRGVWFGKKDRWKALKFQESDLPVVQELGEKLHEMLAPSVLYCWDMVLRPVVSPEGEKAYNIRFDFIAAADASFSPAPGFSGVSLKKNSGYTLQFRARIEEGNLRFFEFEERFKNALPSPVSKKVSTPDLRHSAKLASRISEFFSGLKCSWQVTGIGFHRSRHAFLRIQVELYTECPLEIRMGGDSASCRAGRRECISFQLHSDLTYKEGSLKRLSLFGRLFSSI